MRKMLVTLLLLAASLQGAAQAAIPPGPHGTAPAGHNAPGAAPAVGSPGMVDVIKRGTLSTYRAVKIGEAFDRYSHLKTKEWREARGAAGTIYVDFCGSTPTGWLDFKARRAGISSKGIEVKFVIYPNGEYGVVMVSRTVVTTGGATTRYPISDIKGVVDAIYNNKKLDL